jgi:hypothetical protein
MNTSAESLPSFAADDVQLDEEDDRRQPRVKPLEKLPAYPRQKFKDFAQEAADANHISRGIREPLQAEQEELRRLKARFVEIAPANRNGWHTPEAQLNALKAQIEEQAARVAELEDLAAIRSQRRSEKAQYLRTLNTFVTEELRGDVEAVHCVISAPPLQLDRGIADAIEVIRDEISQLRADVDQTNLASRTKAAAKKIARANLRKLALGSAPDVLPILERASDEIGWPEHKLETIVNPSDTIVDAYAPDARGLTAWLFEDLLAKKIDQLIDELGGDDEHALEDQERAARVAQLEARILDLERREEAHIVAAQNTGVAIPRRPDLNPLAFLEVELVKPINRRRERPTVAPERASASPVHSTTGKRKRSIND